MSKKNKCIENTIGKIIYLTLMFLPIIWFCINCLVMIFNQNATITDASQLWNTSVVNSLEFVEDTALYTTIDTMLTGLDMNEFGFNYLLPYWLLMTAIYIIYDIALIMVQMAHKKIHNLIEQ